MTVLRKPAWWASRVSLAIIVCIMTSLCCSGEQVRAVAKGWDRDFLEDNPDLDQRRFFLAILSSIDDRLIGYFVFRNSSIAPILLHGMKTQNDDFWPLVKAEVATARDGNWTAIAFSAEGKATESLTVGPNGSARVMVKMDSFLPFLSKFKFGRVLLENGEVACFELKDLLPPHK